MSVLSVGVCAQTLVDVRGVEGGSEDGWKKTDEDG